VSEFQGPASAIARTISVSRWYAGRIREGYRPHPRLWQALAGLVGVSCCSVANPFVTLALVPIRKSLQATAKTRSTIEAEL
jgi:hypothetical protein